MSFWIFAVLLAVLLAAVIAASLLRGERTDGETDASHDLQIYRDQLREVERDAARGLIDSEEAERTRLEVSRKILEADRQARSGRAPGQAPRAASLTAGVAVVAVLGGGLWLYRDIGAPGYADQPIGARLARAEDSYLSRPTQAKAEAAAKARAQSDKTATPAPATDPQFQKLMEELRATVARRPDDPKGLELLARNEAGLGHYAAAWQAQAKLNALLGDKAGAVNHATQGEYMVMAAGGEVSPEAEAQFTQALREDPKSAMARYYLGLMLAQNGRPDRAFPLWDGLLRDSDPKDPWVGLLQQNLPLLAWLAGQDDYVVPKPRGLGPDRNDLIAAATLAPEARETALRDKVEALNSRLGSTGGQATDWARLIAGLHLLGEDTRAQSILQEARQVFAGNPDMVDLLARAARGDWPQEFPAGATAATTALPGPSAQEMRDAAQLSPQERQQMIQGMVDGLVSRLQDEGGSPAEWARALSALGKLGQTERAQEILHKGEQALAADPAGLAQLRAAAKAEGIAQ